MTDDTNEKKSTLDIAFGKGARAEQEKRGSADVINRWGEKGGMRSKVTEVLKDFVTARDSFYIGSASACGRPYIQHRGGERGFLKVLSERFLAFADYAGNRQYITLGNLAENDKAMLIMMDYPQQKRIKVWGRAKVEEEDQEILNACANDDGEVPDRAIVFEIEAWDNNCPKYILPRFSEKELEHQLAEYRERIAELEAELSRRDAE